MSQARKANQRQRLRQQGLRPLEVWLPKTMIERIDALKEDGEGRDTVIEKLISSGFEPRGQTMAPLQLRLPI